MEPRGVYETTQKNGTPSYRVSISKNGKHISLGSFREKEPALQAYQEANRIYQENKIDILNYSTYIHALSDDKVISLLNHRDNGLYFKTPIYLRKGYFSYFLSGYGELKFDNDDLFYYSSHRILRRGGHLYVNDYGMQYGILARYGIKNFAVSGRDYRFANGDPLDLRYSNVIVINKYHGVQMKESPGKQWHEARIHIVGDFLLGRYETDSEAATAYNKAADAAAAAGIDKNFIQNYILEYDKKQYWEIYSRIDLPKKYLDYISDFKK